MEIKDQLFSYLTPSDYRRLCDEEAYEKKRILEMLEADVEKYDNNFLILSSDDALDQFFDAFAQARVSCEIFPRDRLPTPIDEPATSVLVRSTGDQYRVGDNKVYPPLYEIRFPLEPVQVFLEDWGVRREKPYMVPDVVPILPVVARKYKQGTHGLFEDLYREGYTVLNPSVSHERVLDRLGLAYSYFDEELDKKKKYVAFDPIADVWRAAKRKKFDISVFSFNPFHDLSSRYCSKVEVQDKKIVSVISSGYKVFSLWRPRTIKGSVITSRGWLHRFKMQGGFLDPFFLAYDLVEFGKSSRFEQYVPFRADPFLVTDLTVPQFIEEEGEFYDYGICRKVRISIVQVDMYEVLFRAPEKLICKCGNKEAVLKRNDSDDWISPFSSQWYVGSDVVYKIEKTGGKNMFLIEGVCFSKGYNRKTSSLLPRLMALPFSHHLYHLQRVDLADRILCEFGDLRIDYSSTVVVNMSQSVPHSGLGYPVKREMYSCLLKVPTEFELFADGSCGASRHFPCSCIFTGRVNAMIAHVNGIASDSETLYYLTSIDIVSRLLAKLRASALGE